VKVLNEIGGRVWELADGARSISDIITIICQEYAVEEHIAHSDVTAFIGELVDKGVLSLK